MPTAYRMLCRSSIPRAVCGRMNTLLLAALLCGFMEGFDIDAVLEEGCPHRPNDGVPTFLVRGCLAMRASSNACARDASVCVPAVAPLPGRNHIAFEARTGHAQFGTLRDERRRI